MEIPFYEISHSTHGLERLQKDYKPLDNQKYCVVTYVIVNEVVNGLHGMWFFVGTYKTAKKANKVAIDIIKKYNIQSTYAMPVCQWREIDENFKPDKTIFVGDEKKENEKNLGKMIDHEQKRLKKEFEKQAELRQDLEKDNEKMLDPESVQFFTRKWFLLINKYRKIEEFRKIIEEEENKYNEMLNEVRELEKEYPNHKESWIDILKEKLQKRGEHESLENIIKYHKIID